MYIYPGVLAVSFLLYFLFCEVTQSFFFSFSLDTLSKAFFTFFFTPSSFETTAVMGVKDYPKENYLNRLLGFERVDKKWKENVTMRQKK